MSANPTPANNIKNTGGFVWNRLHSEREDICEALLRVQGCDAKEASRLMSEDDGARTANWHRELLQSRLRKIDDALDRLISGSYGSCSKCGRWIEDTKLDFDPAVAFCIDCWPHQQSQNRTKGLIESNSHTRLQPTPAERSGRPTERDHSGDGVKLATLAPFDTICARTRNSDYRIFMLDPKTGRALIEGGSDFGEPMEGTVTGSQMGSIFKVGRIETGLRIEFWVDGKIISTSPVQSFRVEHYTSHEVVSSLSH